MARKRKVAQQRAHAEELRTQAATQSSDLEESHRRTREAEAQAQLKQAEAERAAREAEQARQGHTVEQARQEEVLREADRVDPDVNHRADDYSPNPPPMATRPTETGTTGTGYDETSTTRSSTTEGTTTEGTTTEGTDGTNRGSHRADGPGTTPA
jgi:hypothetical protein